MGLAALCFWFTPGMLISVDFNIHNPDNFAIIQDIEKLLAVSALFQIAEAIRISLFGALRALKDTRFTLLISIICFWGIALPCGYLFGFYFQLGGPGIWSGMVIGVSIGAVVLFWRFISKMKIYESGVAAVELG